MTRAIPLRRHEGFDESAVRALIIQYAEAFFMDYFFDRCDYILALPHSQSFIMDKDYAARYARSLAQLLWKGPPLSDERKALLKYVEPLGLLASKELRDAVDAVADGVWPPPYVLRRRFYEEFGAVAIAGSGSEFDVKVGKLVLREGHTRWSNITTRFRLLLSENDFDERIVDSFPDGDARVRAFRAAIRDEPVQERDARRAMQAVDTQAISDHCDKDLESVFSSVCESECLGNKFRNSSRIFGEKTRKTRRALSRERRERKRAISLSRPRATRKTGALETRNKFALSLSLSLC